VCDDGKDIPANRCFSERPGRLLRYAASVLREVLVRKEERGHAGAYRLFSKSARPIPQDGNAGGIPGDGERLPSRNCGRRRGQGSKVYLWQLSSTKRADE